MNIKIFEQDEIHPKAIALLKKNVSLVNEKNTSRSVDGIVIRSYTHITETFLANYPALKYIIRVGVGLDTIDVAACEKRGVKIFNSPGSNANAVSELVILNALLLKRKALVQINSLRQNHWRDRTQIGTEIKGITVGIIGCGAIGQLVARKFLGFDAHEILGYDPFLTDKQLKKFSITKTTLSEIYHKADIISLHVPLTPETRNMIALPEFKKMKRTSILINTSRGGIVNETDLMVALKQQLIAGAALDVFEHEPHINRELLGFDNLIATPHIGALTKDAEEAMATHAVQGFINFTKTLKRIS